MGEAKTNPVAILAKAAKKIPDANASVIYGPLAGLWPVSRSGKLTGEPIWTGALSVHVRVLFPDLPRAVLGTDEVRTELPLHSLIVEYERGVQAAYARACKFRDSVMAQVHGQNTPG